MSVWLYQGGFHIICKSGVGQAILHQELSLQKAGIPTVHHRNERTGVVHINTVFPDSVFTALLAHLQGRKVVYYGHSTQEDFRNSFHGSNFAAPVFKLWIKFCYSLGDIVLTPTRYSKALLQSYGIQRPIYVISNGVDTDFFSPSKERRSKFRRRYNLTEREKVVISVGHYIERKGILEFIALARSMPDLRFFWFGYTDSKLIPQYVQNAISTAPANLYFPGYVDQAELRDAYCGADIFTFLSREETEGIVVLEALSCGIPVILRDIPVYENWLVDQRDVYKVHNEDEAAHIISGVLNRVLPDLTENGRRAAEKRSLSNVGMQLRSIYQEAGLLSIAETPSVAYESAPLVEIMLRKQ